MLRFLLIFISVYTFMNGLVYFKAKALLPGPLGSALFSPLVSCTDGRGPMGVRFLEKNGYEGPARLLAYLGYN